MAYMKTGAVREVKTRTKVTVGVIVAVLIVALVCVVYAVKNPRSARQLFMSDQNYTSYVILKNLEDAGEKYEPYMNRLTENKAYESTGAASLELSKDMKEGIGSEEALAAAQKYLQQLTFTTTTQKMGLHFSNELQVSDKKQTIFTHNLAYLQSGVYSMVEEYGYGWSELSEYFDKTDEELYRRRVLQAVLFSDNETIQDAVSDAAKAAYKAVKKDIQITIDDDQQLDFQDKHATGQRVNILIDGQDAQAFLEVFFTKLENENDLWEAVNSTMDTDDAFVSEKTFNAFLSAMETEYKKMFRDTEISKVSIDLLIDEQNVIHAFDALIKRSEGDIIVNAMLDDDEHRGLALHVREDGETLLKFNVEKTDTTSGTVSFQLGNLQNSVTYSNLSLSNGLVYGTFEFDPLESSEDSDLGTFGLFLQTSPNTYSDGTVGFHILAQTGFSTIGTATVEADVTEAKYTGMLLEEDIAVSDEYTAEEKQAKRLQYWLSDLPNKNSLYKNALSSVVKNFVSDMLTAAVANGSGTDETLSTGASINS